MNINTHNLTHIPAHIHTPPRRESRFAPRPCFIDLWPFSAERERLNRMMPVMDLSNACLVLKFARAYYWVQTFLHRAVDYNRAIKTKWDMLLSPKWRARVLSELGGEPALRRWEMRKARSLEPDAGPDRSSSTRSNTHAGRNKGERSYKRFKTDASGRFRLAPVTRERDTAPDRSSSLSVYTYGGGVSGVAPLIPDLIPLTPDELRGNCIEPVEAIEPRLIEAMARLELITNKVPSPPESAPIRSLEMADDGHPEEPP